MNGGPVGPAVTTRGHRTVAVWTAGLGAAVFVLLAVWWVPWSPVPGGTPAPAPVGDWFSPAELARAESFARWTRTWSWSSLVVGLAVACWLGFGRVGPRLVGRLPGPWPARVVLGVAAVDLVGRLVTLPFALALHRHLVDSGISTQGIGAYLVDVAKSEVVAIVGLSLVLLVLVGCARRWRRAWPAVAGGVLGLLVLLGSFVYPVLVEPVFHDFESLPEGSLRTEILAVAEAEEVRVDDVLVVDASRRTTTLNAYVSGFGSTRRVVVYDTLVEDLPQDQAVSVVAHELAHARHDDVLVGSVLGVAGTVFAVGLLGLVVTGRRRPHLGDPRVVPLVLALVALATLASAPVQSGISRRVELRADVDALTTTGDGEAFATMQRRLAERSLSDPTPPAWSHWAFGSHPTVLQRLALPGAVLTDDAGPD